MHYRSALAVIFAFAIIDITSFIPLPSQLKPLTSWIVAPIGTGV